jgi:hypothetical protein
MAKHDSPMGTPEDSENLRKWRESLKNLREAKAEPDFHDKEHQERIENFIRELDAKIAKLPKGLLVFET